MMIDIIEAIESSGYSWIGIRHLSDDENYQIGDYCRNSYDWNYEYDCSTYETDEPQELPGTCAYNTQIMTGWDDPEEMEEVGFEDCIYGEGLCLIEWANLIEEILPPAYTQVRIEKDLSRGFDYRKITLTRIGEAQE